MPKPLLLVFGDSPAASTMVGLAELTGFRARQVTQAELGALEVPAGDAYAVVATMGHFDEEALEAALAHPRLEVSLIASTRRAAAVRAELLRRGLGEDAVARVHTPAGRARGATQEEIALLALAEVVTARRKQSANNRPLLQVAPSAPAFAVDPVCGMTVDVATAIHKTEHAGETVYFCGAGCKAAFEADPERYVRTLARS